jgi:hypothetical protein
MRISPANNAHGLDIGSGLDEYDRRVLVVEGVAYDDLDSVMQRYPQLGTTECLALYCEAWIRMHHGTGYRVIRDAADFKTRYQAQTRRGRNTVRASHQPADFGTYDVTEVSEPQLRHDVLRCYVEDRQCGVPYRVEAPWPIHTDTVVEFLLLPLQDDEDEAYV